MGIMTKRSAPAVQRNREPILEVLNQVLPDRGQVLEIAAGSGEHAVFFAPHFPRLTWLPTDPDADQVASITAWMGEAEIANLHPPVRMDVLETPWAIAQAEAVLCINMIHISPWVCTLALLDGAARVLAKGGVLYLYGPYRIGGAHTAPSNAEFDQWLQAQNAAWGVRDLDVVKHEAAQRGLTFSETVQMPANNLSVIFRRD